MPKSIEKSAKRKAATKEEENIIKSMPDNEEFCFLAKFLLYTGCRRGEAVGITPKDIDYENHTFSVTKTVEWESNTPRMKKTPKTGAGNRLIPIPSCLMPELIKRKHNNYIFQDENRNLYQRHRVWRGWVRMCEKYGIECTMHQLRHSYTTMLFDAGIDVKTAQTWLGHTDIKTTLDIYTHLSEQRQEQSINKWFDYLKNTP